MNRKQVDSIPLNAGVNEQMLSRQEAKARLIELGWTYQTAAPVLGLKAPGSLCLILNGKFQNKRVLREIAALGPSGRRRYERRMQVANTSRGD